MDCCKNVDSVVVPINDRKSTPEAENLTYFYRSSFENSSSFSEDKSRKKNPPKNESAEK
jgi:hypothetical protein